MSELKTKLPTDIWVVASWEEFIDIADSPAYQKAKCYYRNGQMRIETLSVSPDRARYNAIALFAFNIFCTIKSIPVNGFNQCSYRQTGVRECQPDLSYYIGDRAKLAPVGTSIDRRNRVFTNLLAGTKYFCKKPGFSSLDVRVLYYL